MLESNETWIVSESGYGLSISADGQRTAFLADDIYISRLWVYDHAAPLAGPPDDITQIVSDPPVGPANG